MKKAKYICPSVKTLTISNDLMKDSISLGTFDETKEGKGNVPAVHNTEGGQDWPVGAKGNSWSQED